ncbi:MAG TPA: cell division protein FtsZ [Candidatus Aminicenantes bacterium]|nr:cell division protein FtsZ [Candidatus Aminicenantes bacterium]HRY65070.1 cell division protein FtsZ [Candidatus Aminicenantes bacterium]HRZ71983.1 cell division protein FtsZ [Candidatus Aminicenantes bacterium]
MNDESRLKFHLVEDQLGAKIKVIGLGGGGGNAVNRMIEHGVQGVEFIAVNTDLQALNANRARTKIPIGQKLTKGLGSGGRPETGRQAAMEDTERLVEILQGADMIFLTTGLGGGTGTGSTPIIANIAAEMDILVIAIVTLPFGFEGKVRMRQAEEGLKELKTAVDTVIAIPNERLLQTVNINTSVQDAFRLADDILRQAAQGISDLITKPGLINLDFADVKSVMKGMGMAFMGTGLAAGENRALEAAEKAISSPLLVDTSIEGAHGVLINITGGKTMTLHEVSKASQLIHSMADPDANIIFGTVIDESMKDTVKVTVIATGFDQPADKPAVAAPTPAALEEPERGSVRARTPAPFPVQQQTPPYFFEGRGGGNTAPVWEPTTVSDKQWEHLETPAFIRRTKHSAMRKTPHDIS